MLRRLALTALLLVTPVALAAPEGGPAGPPVPEVGDDAAWVDLGEGLSILDMAPGEGAPWAEGFTGRAAMTVWNAEGAVVYHSGTAGGPLEVTPGAGAFIPGVEQAVIGMKPDGVRMVRIPAAQAYGESPPDGAPAGDLTVLLTRLDDPPPPVVREPPAAPTQVAEGQWTEFPSGLRVADLAVGDGAVVEKGQRVRVEYTGWLVEDGTLFDSSYKRPLPFEFTVGKGEVILGWDKGVVGMKVGGRRVLEVPAYLAYGSRAQGLIPEFADLVFEIELLAIQ